MIHSVCCFVLSYADSQLADHIPDFEFQFLSDNWLHEMMPAGIDQDPLNPRLDSLCDDIDIIDTFHTASECTRHPVSMMLQHEADVQLSCLPTESEMALTQVRLDGDFQRLPKLVDSQASPASKQTLAKPWPNEPALKLNVQSIQDCWTLDEIGAMNIPIALSNEYNQFQSPRASQESDHFSDGDPENAAALDKLPISSCTCYRHAMTELLRSGLRGNRNGFSSIDGILNCQKDVIIQTESILQCQVCSQTELQANMLMLVIVTIDSLLTSIDATATLARAGADDESTISRVPRRISRQKEAEGGLKSHIDACPLFVGEFSVPPDEKVCFIRQVLQARLSMLLITIRRIRTCMQRHLTRPISRGRLLMIMETDRRLQLIMMRTKMAVG